MVGIALKAKYYAHGHCSSFSVHSDRIVVVICHNPITKSNWFKIKKKFEFTFPRIRTTLSCRNQNMSTTVVYSLKVPIKAHMIKCYAFYLLYLRVVLFVWAAFLVSIKALDRLLGWIYWLILTLLPILDQNHKGLVLKIAKVPLQISFKQSKLFLAFLVNCWP